MSEKMSKKNIEKAINKAFKEITVQVKLLKVLHELSVLTEKMGELERVEFEKKVKENIGEADFDRLKNSLNNFDDRW